MSCVRSEPASPCPPTPLSLALLLAFATSLPAVAQPAAPAPAPAPAQAASAPDAHTPSTTEAMLPVVKVKAATVRDATTEGAGYAPAAVTLGKDTRSLREVPQSVTVITREQLSDQRIVTIESALKNVTGVTVQRYDATGTYTEFMARGYEADSYLLDGLNVQTDANGIYFDLAAYDRVEVQRGASGLFSGTGEPGITVNMARKRALREYQAEGTVSLGSWKDRRVDLDVTGALNDTGSLRGRVVGVAQNFDTFMDGIDNNRKRMLYGTLEADIAPGTTLSTGATWQKVDTVLSRGLPTRANGELIDMPRSTMPVQAWNRQTLESRSAFVELERRSDDDALLKVALRHLQRDNAAEYLDPSIPAADGAMTDLAAAAFKRQDRDDTADIYYSLPFDAWGLKHNLLVGADHRRSENRTHYADYGSVPGSLNLFRFDPYAIPRPDFDLGNEPVSDVRTVATGVYSQLRIKPGTDWTLIGGGRASRWKSHGYAWGSSADVEMNGQFTPYAAALYELSPTLSGYASYSQIFKPQSARTSAGEQIKPRTGRQLELGIKGEARDARVTYSAAVYRLVDENRAVTDPLDNNYSIARGKARSQGAEFELHGELAPGWSASGGYAYTTTKLLRDAPETEGAPVSSFTPRHSYNLWVRHQRLDGPARGLVFGLGLRGMSDFYNGSGAELVRGPGYTLYSMNVAYPISDRYRVSLNVDNLFDKTYWEKVSYPGRQNFFGEPRRITLALNGRF